MSVYDMRPRLPANVYRILKGIRLMDISDNSPLAEYVKPLQLLLSRNKGRTVFARIYTFFYNDRDLLPRQTDELKGFHPYRASRERGIYILATEPIKQRKQANYERVAAVLGSSLYVFAKYRNHRLADTSKKKDRSRLSITMLPQADHIYKLIHDEITEHIITEPPIVERLNKEYRDLVLLAQNAWVTYQLEERKVLETLSEQARERAERLKLYEYGEDGYLYNRMAPKLEYIGGHKDYIPASHEKYIKLIDEIFELKR